jgi:hypothetical protein
MRSIWRGSTDVGSAFIHATKGRIFAVSRRDGARTTRSTARRIVAIDARLGDSARLVS